jgi:hydrogenase maturation protease
MKKLVLGLGNLLLADEGVGVHAVRALSEGGLPEDTTVLDVGTAILDALPFIEEADRIIVVDAVKAGGEPGTIYRMPMNSFRRKEMIASMHGFDLFGVLALAGRTLFPEVLVIGVEPARIEWSMELSPRVADSLPAVVQAVREMMDPTEEDAPDPPAQRMDGLSG